MATFLASLEEPQLDGVGVLRNVGVPARDGVQLGTDVYVSVRYARDQPTSWPVIVMRTPYGKHRANLVVTAPTFADVGYAVVLEDMRG